MESAENSAFTGVILPSSNKTSDLSDEERLIDELGEVTDELLGVLVR